MLSYSADLGLRNWSGDGLYFIWVFYNFLKFQDESDKIAPKQKTDVSFKIIRNSLFTKLTYYSMSHILRSFTKSSGGTP
jgi:hypothetical protein